MTKPHYKIKRYTKNDSMASLICENYPMLFVVSRFDIALGFGDKTIDEVCRLNGVDTATLLAVVNLIFSREQEGKTDLESLSFDTLLKYLSNSHKYYLDFRLPTIRERLKAAVLESGNEISALIVRYFDEYVAQISHHMNYEEQTVFPYIEALRRGETDNQFSIQIFSTNHDHIDEQLKELRDVIIKYYPEKSSPALTSVLYEILIAAQDLLSHNLIEDNLLVPLVKNLEERE